MEKQTLEPETPSQRMIPPSPQYEVWEPESRLNLAYYLRILIRRRWLVLATLLVVVTGTAAYSFWATPVYEAVAQVEIQPPSASSSEANQALAMTVEPGRALQTQIELIKSQAVLEPAARRLGLNDPSDLERSLSVKLLTGTQIVEIRSKHEDPAKAGNWANAVADGYIDFRRKRLTDVSAAASESIGRRIAAARAGLNQIEQQLGTNPGSSPGLGAERQTLIAELSALQAELVMRLTSLETKLAELPDPEQLSQGGAMKVTTAERPEQPVSPNFQRNLAWAAVLGALLGGGLALSVDGLSAFAGNARQFS